MANQQMLDCYYMKLAFVASELSTCPRASVGAVVVAGGQIVSTGYNGAPSHVDHCTDVGCLMQDGRCKRAVHAELNALLQAGDRAHGATIYCNYRPCFECTKAIINAQIVRVVYSKHYDAGPYADEFLQQAGVEIVRIDVTT